jgi:hypothetical protein
MHDSGDWTCPACAITVTTPYCPQCGEQHLDARHLTLCGFAAQIAAEISSIDRRLLRSLRTLVVRPGVLTAAYRRGERARYLLPISLFLFANLLFFAMQSVADIRIFSTPLDMHLNDQFWKPLANAMVSARLAHTGSNLATYAPVFDAAVALNAKTLIGLMVPFFTLFLPLVFWGGRAPFVVHAVFALHFYAFALLLLCLVLAVLTVSGWLGAAAANSLDLDHVLSLFQLAILFGYLWLATGAVYGARGIARLLQAALLTVVAGGLLLAYRFFLFAVTLYTT